jgi:hypothetical protein
MRTRFALGWVMVGLAFAVAGCGDGDDDKGVAEAGCCCEFVVEGDIIEEDLLDEQVCLGEREQGRCIEVDPGRSTPHPCCPDAKGDTCSGS